MKLLVQFPTLCRKEKFLNCIAKYDNLCGDHNDIFFNINCDIDDGSMNNDSTRQSIKSVINKATYRINYLEKSNKISAINDKIDVDFDVVLCASDDMIPVVDKWDEYICCAMQEYFPNLDGALHFNDGYTENNLITLSILGKKLYDYFGYIYHPDYKSLYCDNEFTEVVKALSKVKYLPDIIIKHEHYSREGNINSGDLDFSAKKTLFFSGRDGEVYNKRKALGFPTEKITND
jgi:hypothetical protein